MITITKRQEIVNDKAEEAQYEIEVVYENSDTRKIEWLSHSDLQELYEKLKVIVEKK